jgi:excisionase family DNA binding protein
MSSNDTLTSDLLHGTAEIAEFLNIKRRTAEYWIEQKRLPIIRMGRTICARRASLIAALQQLEEQLEDA